jgi:hypothetical protein
LHHGSRYQCCKDIKNINPAFTGSQPVHIEIFLIQKKYVPTNQFPATFVYFGKENVRQRLT